MQQSLRINEIRARLREIERGLNAKGYTCPAISYDIKPVGAFLHLALSPSENIMRRVIAGDLPAVFDEGLAWVGTVRDRPNQAISSSLETLQALIGDTPELTALRQALQDRKTHG